MKKSVRWGMLIVSIVIVSVGGHMTTYANDQFADMRKEVLRFDEVAPGVYRGGQPSEKGIQMLKEFGIRTIINMRNEEDWRDKEATQVMAIGGIEYVELPWTIYGAYQPEVFKTFFSCVEDSEKKPVFFHCKRGSERTGVMAALYKMKHEGYSYAEAITYANKYDIKFIWQQFVRSKIKEYEERNAHE